MAYSVHAAHRTDWSSGSWLTRSTHAEESPTRVRASWSDSQETRASLHDVACLHDVAYLHDDAYVRRALARARLPHHAEPYRPRITHLSLEHALESITGCRPVSVIALACVRVKQSRHMHGVCPSPMHARGGALALAAPRVGHGRRLCSVHGLAPVCSVRMPLCLVAVVMHVRLVCRGHARPMRRSERLDELRLDKALSELLRLLVVGAGVGVVGSRAPSGALLDACLVRRRRVGRTQPYAC